MLTEHRIFHQCDSLVVKYNVLANHFYAIWARDQTPATIAAGYERILLYLRRERYQRLLDNHEAIHGYWADSADWLSQDWYLRALGRLEKPRRGVRHGHSSSSLY